MMQLAAVSLLAPDKDAPSDPWHDDAPYRQGLKHSLLLVIKDPEAYKVFLRQPELLARMERELTQVRRPPPRRATNEHACAWLAGRRWRGGGLSAREPSSAGRHAG